MLTHDQKICLFKGKHYDLPQENHPKSDSSKSWSDHVWVAWIDDKGKWEIPHGFKTIYKDHLNQKGTESLRVIRPSIQSKDD